MTASRSDKITQPRNCLPKSPSATSLNYHMTQADEWTNGMELETPERSRRGMPGPQKAFRRDGAGRCARNKRGRFEVIVGKSVLKLEAPSVRSSPGGKREWNENESR